MGPQFAARAVCGRVEIHHAAQADHHVLAGVAAVRTRNNISCPEGLASLTVKRPQFRSTSTVLGLEERHIAHHGLVRAFTSVGSGVLHYAPGGAVGRVMGPQAVVGRVKEQSVAHHERHVFAGVAADLTQF